MDETKMNFTGIICETHKEYSSMAKSLTLSQWNIVCFYITDDYYYTAGTNKLCSVSLGFCSVLGHSLWVRLLCLCGWDVLIDLVWQFM